MGWLRWIPVLLVLATAASVGAGAPAGVSFQGVGFDPLGSPLEGPHDVVLRIFDDPVSTAPSDRIYQESHPATGFVDGVFGVVIGTGSAASGPFAASLFAVSPDLWLEVEIAGEVLVPRTKFQSVPFALQVAKEAVTSSEIRDQSVHSVDVLDETLGGSDIRNGSLLAADLGDEAGADFASGDQNVTLGATAIVRSVSITAPSAGVVIVNASGVANIIPSGGISLASTCSITTGSALDSAHIISWTQAGSQPYKTPLAATRGFSVAPGTTDFNLVCRGAGDKLEDTSLTALFVPTRY
jgi:hypothetical protein